MKKILAFVLLAIMSVSAVACVPVKNPNSKIPYEIVYTADASGNGTCSATVKLNPNYYGRTDIVIPDSSPEGDAVTAVSFADSFVSITESFPKVITRETMDDILAQMASKLENGTQNRIYLRMLGFYVNCDLDKINLAPSLKNKMLEDYPFIEYVRNVYVFDEKAKRDEYDLIAEYIYTYTDYDARKLAKDEMNKIRSIMRKAGVPDEQMDQMIRKEQRHTEGLSTLCINSVKLPSGIKHIDFSTPESFYLSEIVVPAGAALELAEAIAYADIDRMYCLDTEMPTGFTLPEEVYKLPDGTVVSKEDYSDYELQNYATVGIPEVLWYSETRPSEDTLYGCWAYYNGVPTAWNRIS